MTDSGTFRARARTQDDLDVFVADVLELLPVVEELVPAKARGGGREGGGGGGKRFEYALPWNTPAASLVIDVHHRARRHETALSLLLFQSAKYRGSSDDNTREALVRLPVLIRAAVRADLGEHPDVVKAVASLALWPARMRRLLDHDPADTDPRPWTKAPGDLSCPHCNRRLWLEPGWQHLGAGAPVWCRHCTDDNGLKLRWPADAWLAVLQAADTPSHAT